MALLPIIRSDELNPETKKKKVGADHQPNDRRPTLILLIFPDVQHLPIPSSRFHCLATLDTVSGSKRNPDALDRLANCPLDSLIVFFHLGFKLLAGDCDLGIRHLFFPHGVIANKEKMND